MPTNILLFLSVYCYSYYLLLLLWKAPPHLLRAVEPQRKRVKESAAPRKVRKYVRRSLRWNPLITRQYCLFRSLLLYRYLSLYSLQPCFNVGISLTKPERGQVRLDTDAPHCWVTLDGVNISDGAGALPAGDELVVLEGMKFWAAWRTPHAGQCGAAR